MLGRQSAVGLDDVEQIEVVIDGACPAEEHAMAEAELVLDPVDVGELGLGPVDPLRDLLLRDAEGLGDGGLGSMRDL